MGLPTTIYKFCDRRGVDLFRHLRLKITPPNQFNDPFELTAHAKGEMTHAESHQIARNEEALRDIYVELGSPGTFKAFRQLWQDNQTAIAEGLRASYPDTAAKFAVAFLDKVSEAVGIACFTATYSDILMWSHYADAHRGFVVGFDTRWEVFRSERGLFPLEYSEERPAIDFVRPLGRVLPDEVFRLIKTKSKHWAYEVEYRQMFNLPESVRDGSGEKPVFFVPVPGDIIQSVTLGYRCPDALQSEICEAVRAHQLHVNFRRAAIHRSKYELDFIEC